ncbi:MAG TPA: hypothetical protein VM283_02070 [Armatimonadota bacterium]|nr:hypothetical protein [Armatimonadota bacterium]
MPKTEKKEKLSGEKLCKLAKEGDIKSLGALARDAKYICGNCGRASSSKKSVCKPVKI